MVKFVVKFGVAWKNGDIEALADARRALKNDLLRKLELYLVVISNSEKTIWYFQFVARIHPNS